MYESTPAVVIQPASNPTACPTAAGPAVLSGPVSGVGPAIAPAAEPLQVVYESKVFLPGTNYEAVWESVVDVVDDYFQIEREEPVRLLGNVLTEGRIDTRPEIGATLLEPWRRSSIGFYERLESTLQSIRRYAQVRVIPGDRGFWVHVAVFKELEDVLQPENSTVGAATFRGDTSFVRVETPVGQQEVHRGWIQLGRDPILEQEMLGELQSRYGTSPISVPTGL